MNCEEYMSLPYQERFILTGQIIHLLQNDSDSFMALSSMARSAEQNGAFDNVEFFPERQQDNS